MAKHVVPIRDIRGHYFHGRCPCHPVLDFNDEGDLVLIHNSHDKREIRESYEGRCSEGWMLAEGEA